MFHSLRDQLVSLLLIALRLWGIDVFQDGDIFVLGVDRACLRHRSRDRG